MQTKDVGHCRWWLLPICGCCPPGVLWCMCQPPLYSPPPAPPPCPDSDAAPPVYFPHHGWQVQVPLPHPHAPPPPAEHHCPSFLPRQNRICKLVHIEKIVVKIVNVVIVLLYMMQLCHPQEQYTSVGHQCSVTLLLFLILTPNSHTK
jgi:hypothetical protein